MLSEEIKEILTEVKTSVEHPKFYQNVYRAACKARKEAFKKIGDNVKRVVLEEYEELSRRLDISGIQDSASVRNVLRTRRIANLLITERGTLNKGILSQIIPFLEQNLYSFGPNRQDDGLRHEHILNVLKLLQEDEKLARKLNRIGRPYNNRAAEELIKETLGLPSSSQITDADTKRAVLSAWLCYLRQSVGSCFATAPAILVQHEQPNVFLDDLNELLGTGQLKRVFGGTEYSVPISRSFGAGDLKKPLLIPQEATEGNSNLWLSPGLAAAFESVGMIEEDISLIEVGHQVKQLILPVIQKRGGDAPFILLTSEELIREALLNHFELSEEEVQEEENRILVTPASGVMAHAAATGKKQKVYKQFLDSFKTACISFKSLADNALLKAWEFSVASFADTKANFSRWNLFSSLGLGPEDTEGIGACVFEFLKQKLEETNRKVEEFQFEYEQVYTQVKSLERRIQHASSEKEARWIRGEYQSRKNEFYTLEEIRNKLNFKAKRFANLFNELMDEYYQIFPEYFQEVYDADIHEVTTGPYDDSPAGFRLLYKHGRSNTSQWTLIYNSQQFIDSLTNFFTITEREIASKEAFVGLEEELGEMVTAIVSLIRTPRFLEAALYRMAAAHRSRIPENPLDHMDKVEKKPWVYTSGGAMNTLVSCYFGKEDNPTEVDRWVENPMELLVWLCDIMKQTPPVVAEPFLSDPKKGMLMHSPTHAFLLKPGMEPFCHLWQSNKYTYTWVRDQTVAPMKTFIDRLWLEDGSIRLLVKQLAEKVPVRFRESFLSAFADLGGRLSSVEFRSKIVRKIRRNSELSVRGMPVLQPSEIDHLLYKTLPFFPGYQLAQKVQGILEEIQEISSSTRELALEILDRFYGKLSGSSLLSAEQLQEITKAVLSLAMESTTAPFDLHLLISHAAQKNGWALPPPLLFADTNWEKSFFAFVVSPGTGELELWRTDYTCREGSPMPEWDRWLNGTAKDPKWGVYLNPHEYVTPRH